MKIDCDGGVNEFNFAKGDVQYPYALLEDNSVIHIDDINQDNRRLHKYTCPGCKEEFRPRLGNIKAHCFYHYSGNRCNIDKYIHDTAEFLLKQKFDTEEKFEIVMNVHKECSLFQDCLFKTETCSRDEIKTIDLKKYFDECLVEHKYDEFRPDLLLIPKDKSKEPIFIEIWNKHKNSEKKANSKYKIIEIKVQSLEELEELPKHPITESENVTFSHFDTILTKPEKMENHINLIQYTLFERGTSYCNSSEEKCYSYGHIIQKSAVFVAIGREMDFIQDSNHETAKGAMREYATYRARLKGYEPRSCYDCIKCEKESSEDPNEPQSILICQKNRFTTGEAIECEQKDALTCEEYAPMNYSENNSLNLHRFHPISIWEKESKPITTKEKEYLDETRRIKQLQDSIKL